MTEISVDGTRVNYEIVGEGPTALLLHGWAGCIASMSPIREMLQRDYTIVTVDLPGFGRSPKPPGTWGSAEYAQCIGQLLLEIDHGRVLAAVGHSFGGKIALHLAAEGMVECDSLVLVGTPGVRLPPSKRTRRRIALVRMVKRSTRRMPRGVTQAVDRHMSRYGSSDYRNAGEMRDVLVRIVNEDLRDWLPAIREPTLLMWGESDEAAPLEIGRQMETLIPGSGLVTFPRSGHFPYLDEPAAFASVIRSFLTSIREGAQA